MSKISRSLLGASAGVAFSFIGGVAFADSIDPLTYTNDTLGVGESVTIRKTVTVDEGAPTDATIDAYFLVDTSGSMGGVINAAKSAADDIFTEIAGTFGSDVAGGVGVFSENAGLEGSACKPEFGSGYSSSRRGGRSPSRGRFSIRISPRLNRM